MELHNVMELYGTLRFLLQPDFLQLEIKSYTREVSHGCALCVRR